MNDLNWCDAGERVHLVYRRDDPVSVCGLTREWKILGDPGAHPNTCKTCAKHWFLLWAQGRQVAKNLTGQEAPLPR